MDRELGRDLQRSWALWSRCHVKIQLRILWKPLYGLINKEIENKELVLGKKIRKREERGRCLGPQTSQSWTRQGGWWPIRRWGGGVGLSQALSAPSPLCCPLPLPPSSLLLPLLLATTVAALLACCGYKLQRRIERTKEEDQQGISKEKDPRRRRRTKKRVEN